MRQPQAARPWVCSLPYFVLLSQFFLLNGKRCWKDPLHKLLSLPKAVCRERREGKAEKMTNFEIIINIFAMDSESYRYMCQSMTFGKDRVDRVALKSE